MFDMVSRRGFVSLSAVAAAGLDLAGWLGQQDVPSRPDPMPVLLRHLPRRLSSCRSLPANSLEKALPEVQELYTEQTGTTFADTQFKASGDLVEQMRAGATARRAPHRFQGHHG